MPATKQELRYDVFISYRRGAADELALLLQTQLQKHRVAAFLDRDLRRGVFDDMLLRRIAEAPTFLIILNPNTLDRCTDEEDWLRKEIVQAIGSRRNIIPLQVDSFQFTTELVRTMEPAIRELSRYQAVEYSRTYFESTIERIVKIVEEERLKRDIESGKTTAVDEDPQSTQAWRRKWMTVVAGAVIAVLLTVGYFYRHVSAAKLTDKDTVVLAEFVNTTADPVFAGTLRQGLSAQLEQSPFLNLLSDDRITQTLDLMSQPRDARLTHQVVRQVCQRTASAATIEGSIASLGSQYVLGLKAANCGNGDLLAQEQVTATSKEEVLKALGEAATRMRAKLGESLASVQKFDAPPDNVTTPSLEALQAFSLARKAHYGKNDCAVAIPLYQRAISLDPDFAMAYAGIGTCYGNLGQTIRAEENVRKAYALRYRVSERERFYIDAHYEDTVPGNLEAARKTYEVWAQTYPRDGGR